MLRFVWRDLVRNPRRTVASVIGVTLGVGLFSAVLFFIDGSGASMTKRALAPLALDLQVVMTSPLGAGIRLDERLVAPHRLRRGQRARLVLTVRNKGAVPANEVVVADRPPAPLAYVPGTTTLDGRRRRDSAGTIPLSQGLAGTGLNLGTIPAGATVRIAYAASAARAVPRVGGLRAQGRISTREDPVPAPANAAPPLTLAQLTARLRAVPGVAAVDGLAFVDLPPGSLRSGGQVVDRTVRVFGFDRRYRQHHPSIRVVSGAFREGAAQLSAEAARRLAPARAIQLRVPGRAAPLSLPVSGVADLSRATPLFSSRKSNKLEAFLYVPDALVVGPATFQRAIVPAFRAAGAARGTALKSLPLLEADVLVDRSRLRADPAGAFAQTRAIARAIRRAAPDRPEVIDNISNTLQVARDDATVGKRMFLFLGLPGALLAAVLAAYTASVLAGTQRREQANLRLRGAHRGHLLRMLGYRTVAFASVGAVAGTAVGLLSVLAILGGGSLFEASAGALFASALASVGFGMAITALALYVPARRGLRHDISEERSEISLAPAPAWRRLRLDVVLLAAAVVAEGLALHRGAFDAPGGSVSAGRAVSLPSHLLLAPMVAWLGGVLLAVRLVEAGTSRIPVPAPPRFGPVVGGTLGRNLRRRSWTLASGAAGVGLVIAFGTGLAIFTSTYDAGKAADARFTVGSDIRVTPSVLSSRPHPPAFASALRGPGVAAVTPVAFGAENSVLIGPYNEDRKNLAAIEPATFGRVAPLSDAAFEGGSAAAALAALRSDPRGLLVQEQSADDLQVGTGDTVKVLLARGTKRQRLRAFHVVGTFRRLPGFPPGADLVTTLRALHAATGPDDADFFLVRSAERGAAGLARAVGGLQSGAGRRDRLGLETTRTALDKDQSSLTALNVHGLVDLDSLYTLLMTAAGVAIFVAGIMLQRRREYIALLAHGLHVREVRALVLAEAALVAVSGLAAGLAVGGVIAALMVHVLRPLFILDPRLTLPARELAMLAGLALAAALLSALAATAVLRRLSPTEILRET